MLSLSKRDREYTSYEAHRKSPFDKLRVTVESCHTETCSKKNLIIYCHARQMAREQVRVPASPERRNIYLR